MADLRAWLESIGCGRYADAFEENAITLELVGDLTDGDLKELGLNIGDRKRFQRGVAALSAPEAGGAAPATPSGQVQPGEHAERRRLTVMFVDLVGSTALSSRLDPEEWSDVLGSYQEIVAGVVDRLGGYIAQYLGDGLLCFFGWPQAHEDAAERAVEAGLEIIQGVNAITACGENLSTRIGIATGLVVVGDLIGRSHMREQGAIGETLNFAARLQSFAETDQVVISESTRRLIGNAFFLESLGERSFKGITGKQPIYAVTGSNPDHDRFAAREGMTSGAIVGREHELALLLDRWALVRRSEGQVVSLIGEAGIGKSRTCRAMLDALAEEQFQRVTYQCSPYLRDTALWPVIARLTAASGIVADDSAEQKLDRLERLFRDTAEVEEAELAVVADLLGLDGAARYGPITMSPSARRAATFAALTANLIAMSRREPVLLQIEDMHWADPSTIELVNAIIDRIARERVMVLITCRPDNPVVLPNRPYVTKITLNRLDRSGVEEIVARLGGGKLPLETIAAIIERTDGVPLFVEELTKAMVESGEVSVPASLHDTLMARLDRLPELKEIAQIASVFGREFESDPVSVVADVSRQRVLDALDGLRKAELVFASLSGEERYSFKHALVRDAAYESLLNRRRQEIHGRIFEVLQRNESTMPGVLAQHAAEAGRFADAIRYGRLAAEQALRRPAYAEAIAHLETTLVLIDRLPPGDDSLRQRKKLLLLSGQARIAHFGYAHESTVATYAEIERIARETDDKELLIEGLYGRWAGHYVPGRNPLALEIADNICAVSVETEDSLARALGHRLRGTVLTMMGRANEAMTALTEAGRHYEPARHRRHAARFGQDVGVAGSCYRIGVLILMGRLDTAAQLAAEVMRDLDQVNHAHTAAYALGHLACFLCSAEILPLGIEAARKVIEISERDRMPLWAALGHASLAMAHVHEGRDAEALPELRNGLDSLKTLAFSVFRPLLIPAYAIALARSGSFSTATALIAEAQELVEEHDARYSEAEICRAEGQLLLAQGNKLAAVSCFEHAIGRARDLGHLTWELRAAEDLAVLMRESGRAEEARALLAGVLDRFEEGDTLPMLKRVSRVIGELA